MKNRETSSDIKSTDSHDKRESPGSSKRKRLTWSDNDDENPSAAYDNFKKRKANNRKVVAAQSRKAKAVAETVRNAIVGRKTNSIIDSKKASQNRKPEYDQGESESDEDAIENALPSFLKDRRSKFESRRSRIGQEGLRLPPLYDDIDFSDDELLDELEIRPKFAALKPVAPFENIELKYSAGIIPAPIAQWLKEYQVKGTEFLHELFVYQKGGILGDDMGLGKTIQVIAFLTAAFGKTGDERDAKRMRKIRRAGEGRWYPKILIVCPGTLMQNWQNELKRWGWWQTSIYHGTNRDEVLESARMGRIEIMITTYTTYRNEKDSINLVDWDACVADECHIIKDGKAETTKAMNQVNALCRIGLTGTAIQNRYEELWTILNWTNPGRFGSLSIWKSSISEPLKLGQSHDATISQLALARTTAKKLVQNLLPQFFIRRMKTLIAHQLPKKTDKVVFCPLTPAQEDAYENLMAWEVVESIRRAGEMCKCNSGKKRGWCCHQYVLNRVKWQSIVFPMLATCQKLANHLALLIPNGTDQKEKQEKEVEYLQAAVPDNWKQLFDTRDNITNYANQDYCGKWKVLKKLLRFWHSSSEENNKVLVFSHSVRLLKMLHMLFQSTSYNVSYLDGSMTYEDRAIVVDEFNNRPEQFVFLISTKAGGVGLNIVSANKVIVFDPNWNPSYDLQAQDRAYRIGQTRDVEVYRLVSAGTVEEIVYARQIYKQQQANIAYQASNERRYFKGVQDTKSQKGEIFGLKNIFTYQGQEQNVVLRDIVNKTNIAESKAGISVVDMSQSQNPTDNSEELDAVDDWFGPMSSDSNNNEDAAINQLAQRISSEGTSSTASSSSSSLVNGNMSKTTKKQSTTDAVAAILAGAGVQYTHENSEVVGSSKIENRLSRRAQESSKNTNKFVFAHSQDQDLDVYTGQKGIKDGDVDNDDDEVRYVFRPPEDVRKRQFVTLANMMGYTDPVQFALTVEGWTQVKRTECLDWFYRERRKEMERVGHD